MSDDPQAQQLATQEEIDNLSKHIGGLSKWGKICDDFKILMAGYLDLKSQSKLSLCSKADYEIVQIAWKYVHRIKMTESSRNGIHVRIHFDASGENFIERNFSPSVDVSPSRRQHQDQSDTIVSWVRTYPSRIKRIDANTSLRLKNCDYQKAAGAFLESWLKKCHFEVTELEVSVDNYPMHSSFIKFLPKCKRFKIRYVNPEQLRWWLQKIPKQIRLYVAGRMNDIVPADIYDIPQVINSSNVHFIVGTAFTDEHFFRRRAKRLIIPHCLVSYTAVNEFLKKWSRESTVEDFEMITVGLPGKNFENEIFRGLNANLYRKNKHERHYYLIRQSNPRERLSVTIGWLHFVKIYAMRDWSEEDFL